MRSMHTIHNRLFLLFLSCMMALLIIGGFLYYQKTTSIIHAKISDMAEKNISQTVGLFDLLLEGYDSITKSLNSNFELLRLLEARERPAEPTISGIHERTITNIMGAVFYSRDDIVGIHIITNAGKIYNYEKHFAGVIDMNYASTDWYSKLRQSTGEMVWLGLHQGSVINHMQKESVFVFGRQLYNLSTHKPIGIMFIETDPAPILAALSNVTISPNSRVYIADKEDRIVASTEKEGGLLPLFNDLPRPEGDEILVDDRTDELIVAGKAAMADWTVLGLTPKADISSEIDETRQYVFFVIIALVILSAALATLISRNIASPLKLLIREMKQVEMGNFRGSVNVKSFEEINSLVASFNRMVYRMDELIEGITLSSISEKNAQLQALQSQVNPHFLYNTLDMIYWMLDERENDRLGRVILALSHMFRYSSDWEEASKTTLRQELDQMRHYMTIIESRLEGRVSADIRVDSQWLDIPLPKMTIQPIIENAVKSGLEPLDHPGVLRLYTEAKDQELHIVIADNGIGIAEETLEQLRESLRERYPSRSDAGAAGSWGAAGPAGSRSKGTAGGPEGFRDNGPGTGVPASPQGNGSAAGGSAQSRSGGLRRGIGLPNVHRRISLMFGEAYGLRIESRQGEGTTVIIAIPLPTKGG
ncbi:histidine kinase [Paenibacillus oenotherae]|uniref:histidine kinase n=1 Tax=Paenibacillus oenotherae TaxID=1435645 RepID=A0ABS7DCN1_9BACL|nr:sensor histidine kinase [Paenibacillus oenotherae]MBW7477625.1 histidine kinase [Paenibacillus oenotherae]